MCVRISGPGGPRARLVGRDGSLMHVSDRSNAPISTVLTPSPLPSFLRRKPGPRDLIGGLRHVIVAYVDGRAAGQEGMSLRRAAVVLECAELRVDGG